MSLFTPAQIAHLCQDFNELLVNSTLLHCFSNHKRFYLVFEKSFKQIQLLIDFQAPHARFHLLSAANESLSKQPYPPLEKHLKGAILKSVEAINHDRIVQFSFSRHKNSFFLICEFFSKYPNYYLTDANYTILASLHPFKQPVYQFPAFTPIPIPVQPLLNHAQIEKYYFELEKTQDFIDQKEALENILQRSIRKNQATKNHLVQSIENCKNWKKIQHEGDLIKANFDLFIKCQSEIVVWDWLEERFVTLAVDSRLTPQEEMADRFKRAKKLHNGLIPLQAHLVKVEQKIVWLENQLAELKQITLSVDLEAFKKGLPSSQTVQSRSKKIQKNALPYHAFKSAVGISILVGKNAKANERLTFQEANGNDWWLHVQDFSGSHVIIKTGKGQVPDPETLQDAMQLALYYSKAKGQGEAEICVTQRKYVSRFGKGQPGKVQISKHSIHWIKEDSARCKLIKSHSSEENELFSK